MNYLRNDLASRIIENVGDVFHGTSKGRTLSTVQDRKFLLSCLVDTDIDRVAVAKTFGTKTKTIHDAVCLRKRWNGTEPPK